MEIKQDITIGSEFNFFTTKSLAFRDNKLIKIKCVCKCGVEKDVVRSHLVSGHTKSCGCYNRKAASDRMIKYSQKYTVDINHPLYQSFKGMKTRCYNPNVPHYIGPNIKVCDEWKDNFEAYYNWAIDKWSDGLALSRRDEEKDYCPENCIFKTKKEIVAENINWDKARKTCLEKYGVEHYNKTQEGKDKFRETCLKKYNAVSPACTEAVKEKIRATNIKKYGTANISKLKSVRDKAIATNLKRYGHKHPSQVPEIRAKQVDTLLKKYGTVFVGAGKKSKSELTVKGYVEKLTTKTFNSEYKILSGKEIDIYNEELKFGIEYCGLRWHTEEGGKIPDYHYNKYKTCKEAGIRLITIFSDEWINREPQIKNFLKATLNCCSRRYFARKCEVREIDKVIGQKFVEDYHIQGQKRVAAVYFGIFNSDELLGVLSLNLHHRTGKDLVLDRLCFKDDVAIAGGSSRLFSLAIKWAKQNNYTKIVSWSDNRWSYGNVYEKLGFTREKDMKPDYSYVDMQSIHKRISKQSMQKKHIGCPEDVTERDFLFEKKIYRIWDCGKIRWVYNII